MDATTVALWASGIAASAGIVGTVAGAFLGSALQARREAKKEVRENLASVAHALAALQQSMEWVTWHGKNQPHHLDDEMIDEYSKTINGRFADLLGAVSLTAAHDPEVYNRLMGALDTAEDIDIDIARALDVKDGDQRREQFRSCHERARAFYREWTGLIAGAMRGRILA